MSILTKEDRKDLVYACRKALLEQVRGKGVLTESKKAAAENFILNEATYEQLLNLVYNPARETNYMKTEALEKVALEAYAQHLKPAKKAVKESMFKKVEEASVSQLGKAAVGVAKKAASKVGGSKVAGVARKAGATASVPMKKVAQKVGQKAGNVKSKIPTNKAGNIRQKIASKVSKGATAVGNNPGKATLGVGVAGAGTAALAAKRKKK